MNIDELTPEQLEALEAQLEAKKQAAADRVQRERETYKDIVDKTVPTVFKDLQNIVSLMGAAKTKAFNDMKSLIDMKCDLYSVKDTQRSHTFTTAENDKSITLGYRVVDGWDDTVGAGVEKVKNYLASLAKDEQSAMLVSIITDLLKPDAKGNLKASRVLELSAKAKKLGDPELIDGVSIIEAAYRPTKTCSFIEAKYRDENGREFNLPLSMSAIPLNE